jgi:TolB protein
MMANGRNVRRLTHNRVADLAPAWSANGRWIVFVRIFRLGPGTFQWDIFKMRADGSKVRRLTRDGHYDDNPEWSPDGERIVFISDRSGNQDVFVMRPNGKGKRNITRSEESEIHPSWSPSSRWLVFSRFITGLLSDEGWQIFKIRRNGSKESHLTEDDSGLDLGAAWSPNGRRIVFTRDDDLFVMKPDGSNQARLTGGPSNSGNYEVAPDWQPR